MLTEQDQGHIITGTTLAKIKYTDSNISDLGFFSCSQRQSQSRRRKTEVEGKSRYPPKIDGLVPRRIGSPSFISPTLNCFCIRFIRSTRVDPHFGALLAKLSFVSSAVIRTPHLHDKPTFISPTFHFIYDFSFCRADVPFCCQIAFPFHKGVTRWSSFRRSFTIMFRRFVCTTDSWNNISMTNCTMSVMHAGISHNGPLFGVLLLACPLLHLFSLFTVLQVLFHIRLKCQSCQFGKTSWETWLPLKLCPLIALPHSGKALCFFGVKVKNIWPEYIITDS